MSDEKSKKGLRLKTFAEIQNDAVYEIHLFPRKRRTTANKSNISTKPIEDANDNDDQVR